MGRARGRRRLVALAIVLASTGSALGLVLAPQATNPQSNPSVKPSGPSRVVFSLRNDTSSSMTIDSFSSGMALVAGKPADTNADCVLFNAPIGATDATPGPWTLAPNQVKQFQVTPTGPLLGGDHQCTYTVNTTPAGTNPTVTVVFHVSDTAVLDVQPVEVNFGTQNTGAETQTVFLQYYGSGSATFTADISTNPNGMFSLVGCGSGTTCSFPLSPNGSASFQVQCSGSSAVTTTGVLTVAGPETSTVALVCAGGSGSGSGITLTPDPLFLSAPIGGSDTGTVTANGDLSTMITGAQLVGTSTVLTLAGCEPGGPCAFPQSPPVGIRVQCTPEMSSQGAILEVMTTQGTVSSTVTCAPQIGPPVLYVAPTMIHFPDTVIPGTRSDSFSVENHGGGTLTNVVVTLSGTGASSFDFDACTPAFPCSIGAGSAQTVNVTFQPVLHDLQLASLSVTADGSGGSGSGFQSSANVALDGVGIGGVMVVTRPDGSNNYHLDLGTLPLNALGSDSIELRNDGNAVYTANVAGVTAPYALGTNDVTVNANGSGASIGVTCSSSTPSTSNEQTWTITGSGAYAGTPQQITVSCAVADTNVIVDPLAFDFGEVRKGAVAPQMPLTVTNPGPGSVMITKLQLKTNAPGLTLAPPTTMTSLAAGSSAGATLSLDTSADTDLTGEFVDIDVGSAMLSLPVRGKVTTPHSRIAPERLDLGTVCVGTQAFGEVRLINDGTATLAVDAPQMATSESFFVTTAPLTWPATLAAGAELTATVAPTQTASGSVAGMLTWSDDSPASYDVPITLEYVSSGTALSPRGLDFGTVTVDSLATSQRVTLENCDPETHRIRVKQLRGIKGPIGAWNIDPKVGYEKELASHEKQAVLVTFAPPGRGHYEAELLVETDSGEETILLVGDATGRDFDSTSFYSCACNTPGAPWRGWPIALAIGIVSVRRRRGSSSAR